MRQNMMNTYKEIKTAYAVQQTPSKIHGEEVVCFEVGIKTDIWDKKYFNFDAPRCSSKNELESHATIQNRDLNKIILDADFYELSFRVIH